MSQLIQKLFRQNTSRILLSIVFSVAFIAVIVSSVWLQLRNNSESYIENYKETQKRMTEVMGDQVSYMVSHNMSDEMIVQELIKSKVNSSNEWSFLSKNGVLLHAKDANSLLMLENAGIKNESQLLQWLNYKKQIVTVQTINAGTDRYTIGIMSDRNSVMLSSNTSSHTTYIMVSLVFCCMVFFATFIFVITRLNIRDSMLHSIKKDLRTKSRKLEAMSQDILASSQANAEIAATEEIYDENILLALLQQTNDKRLFPMGIIYIRLKLSKRYYEKSELFSIMQGIVDMLKSNHRLIETAKGEYVILLYRSDSQQVDAMKQEIKNYLKEELPAHEISAKIIRKFIPHMPLEEEDSVLDIYNKLRKGIARKGDI